MSLALFKRALMGFPAASSLLLSATTVCAALLLRCLHALAVLLHLLLYLAENLLHRHVPRLLRGHRFLTRRFVAADDGIRRVQQERAEDPIGTKEVVSIALRQTEIAEDLLADHLGVLSPAGRLLQDARLGAVHEAAANIAAFVSVCR